MTLDNNTIGSYAENAYSIVEGAPTFNQSFTNNSVFGQGLKVAIADPAHAGYRPRNVTITGNFSDTAQAPAAINVDHVDGLTIRGNHIPMTGGPMAAIVGSCDLAISGNSYSGGSTQALIYPSLCFFSPARGGPGSKVAVTGSGFNGTTAVTIGGRRASSTLHSGTRSTLTVPRSARSGPITVRTPNGDAVSPGDFTVTSG